MTSRNRRRFQAADVKRRAGEPSPDGPTPCVIPGCPRLTDRSSGRGLSDTYCRIHLEHQSRHGHPTRPSFSKADLTPFRRAAEKWYRQHREDANVRHAIARLESLMASQGRSKDHDHQRSMPPKAKARNVLARLNEAGKSGERLFLITLAIRAAYAELGPQGYPEFPHVQIAKQAKRLRGASGTHYRDGPYRLPSKYPRPRGLYLRILGHMIEERADIDRETIEAVREAARPEASTITTPPPPPPREDRAEELRRLEAYARLVGHSGSITIGTD